MSPASFLLDLWLVIGLSGGEIALDGCETIDAASLAPILRHCHEESAYRDLTVIKLEKAQLDSQLYSLVHERLNLPMRGFSADNYGGTVPSGSCVLLYLPAKDIKEMLRPGSEYPWNPENLYVLVASGRSGSEECGRQMPEEDDISGEHMFQGLNGLWKDRGIYKVAVATRNGSFYYLDPFEPQDSAAKLSVNPEGIGTDEKARSGALKNLGATNEGLKSRKDFQGYGVEVALFQYITVRKSNGTFSGMDWNAMEEICRRMNVTWRIYEPKEFFGWVDANGTFHGTLGRLIYHRSDLSFNSFFVKSYQTTDLVFATYVTTDKICVMVPNEPATPEYLLIVRIFSVESWSLIIVGNCLLALVYVAMTDATLGWETRGGNGKLRWPRRGKSMESDGFFASWVFFSVYPMKTTTKSDALRFLVNFGLLLGIIITGSFTSQLASSLSKPSFEKNIDSLQELAESKYEILTMFPDLMHNVFADDETWASRRLQAKMKLENASEIERRVTRVRNAGYLNQANQILLESFAPYNLHLVAECPKSYTVAYAIHRGSPYLHRINEIIGRLHNGGIVQKWFNDMKIPATSEEKTPPVVIRMSHLYIPFVILLCGLGIGVGVFFFEIWSLR